MAKVLVIKASMIKDEASFSTQLTNLFLKYYVSFNPKDEIIHLDLNNTKCASITLTSNNMATYFNEIDCDYYINQLKSVHKVIFSCPMTNFNITATAKNYLDHILVANKTFSYKYSKKGDAIGLLQHLKVQLLTTQGAPLGWYLWGDHTNNLKGTWKFMGATVVEPIIIDGVKIPENANKTPIQKVSEYDGLIQKAAKGFALLSATDYFDVLKDKK